MTMSPLKSRALTSIVAEILFVCLLGYFFIGKEIFVVRHSMFSYLVLSLTLIGGFSVLFFRGKTEFYYLALFVTVVLAVSWFLNHSFSLTFRSLGRFWVIVAVVIAAWGILRAKRVSGIRFIGVVVWLAMGIVFYLVMVMMDVYVFSLYPEEVRAYRATFLLESVKLGAVMGLGIGLGYELGRLLSPASRPPETPSRSTPS